MMSFSIRNNDDDSTDIDGINSHTHDIMAIPKINIDTAADINTKIMRSKKSTIITRYCLEQNIDDGEIMQY